MRFDMGGDRLEFLALLLCDCSQAALHGFGAQVVVGEIVRGQQLGVGHSRVIEYRDVGPVLLDVVQHGDKPVVTIIPLGALDKSRLEYLIVDANLRHRFALLARQYGPVGLQPGAGSAIGARSGLAQDTARFLDQRLPSGFRGTFGFHAFHFGFARLSLFLLVLEILAMPLPQCPAEVVVGQAFYQATFAVRHCRQVEDEAILLNAIGRHLCGKDQLSRPIRRLLQILADESFTQRQRLAALLD
ncbi:hypothetical protein ATB93_11000 [Sphingomonas sp. WG]|nr:hypothetical protein ATB93_11000 [Sphingomonas sp. WG]